LDLAYIATIDGKNRIISQAEIKPRTVILPNPKLLETLWEIARSAGGDIAFSSIEMFKGEPHFFVVKMLSDNRLVLAPLSPHYVRKVQKSIAFGDRGHSMIVDHRGRVVAHPNAQWQASSKDASKLSVVKKMISGGTGVTTFYSPPMRADMIAGYTFVPETGWGVMVPQPTSELIESARKVQFVGFVVAVVVIAFAIGASWWLSLFLTRPIRAVADAAYRISNGDLTARADLTSSYVPIELKDLGKAFNQMAEDLKFKTDALTQDITELNMAQVQALRNAALRDYLTGMYNRRYFFDLALPIFENAKRQNSDLMVAMMDIDHFKSVNDSYGHGVGDEVLVIVAGLLEKVIRSTDIIARFGGEEFCLIATAMPPEAAKKYLDSVRDNISKLVFSEKSLSITVSIGATNNLTFSLDKMISDADKMLYHAKESGRNKVVTA
jgi:diguanylate cyclase (GGDEF)-like protein